MLTSALEEAMQRAIAVTMVVPSFIFLGFGFKEQSWVLGVIVLWKIMRRFWERRREIERYMYNVESVQRHSVELLPWYSKYSFDISFWVHQRLFYPYKTILLRS